MKKLFWMAGVGLALTLTACGGNNGPQATTFDSYSGKVVESTETATGITPKVWTGGAGQVKGYIGSTLLTTGTLNADGNFTISLPAPNDEMLNNNKGTQSAFLNPTPSGYTCTTNTLKMSDTNARVVALELKAEAGSLKRLLQNATVKINSKTATSIDVATTLGSFVYSDRPLTLTGQAVCSISNNAIKNTVIYDVNAALAKGWNKVTVVFSIQQNMTERTGKMSLSSGSLPSDNWYSDFASDGHYGL